MQDWYNEPASKASQLAVDDARKAWLDSGLPQNTLGEMQSIAERLCALQGTQKPSLERVAALTFAGDHGVCTEGVSALAQGETLNRMAALASGRGAMAILCRELSIPLTIVDVGTCRLQAAPDGVKDCRVAAGSANICREPAMSVAQLDQAMQVGREQVAEFADAQLFIGGEIGVGNSTIATAMAVAMTKLAATAMTGPSTGLDAMGVQKKTAVVTRALSRHLAKIKSGRDVLQYLGGFEVAALAGAYIAAAQQQTAVLVDGYICTAAAMAAVQINPSIRPWLFFSHASSEPGHSRLLGKLDATPMLSLGMALGEGSGAALALPLMRSACALHRELPFR